MNTAHKWQRTDMGIGRSLECTCGFVAAGYTWNDVYQQKEKHEKEVAKDKDKDTDNK